MSLLRAGQNYSRSKCHTVTSHPLFHEIVRFGSECHSSEMLKISLQLNITGSKCHTCKTLQGRSATHVKHYRVKVSQQKKVTADHLLGGHFVQVKVPRGCLVGGHIIKAPFRWSTWKKSEAKQILKLVKISVKHDRQQRKSKQLCIFNAKKLLSHRVFINEPQNYIKYTQY